jgi:hypothetical protein
MGRLNQKNQMSQLGRTSLMVLEMNNLSSSFPKFGIHFIRHK